MTPRLCCCALLLAALGSPADPPLTGNIDCWFYHSRSTLCRSLFPSATDAFVAPPGGVFGNAGRNVLRGAGAVVFDFSLHRSSRWAATRGNWSSAGRCST